MAVPENDTLPADIARKILQRSALLDEMHARFTNFAELADILRSDLEKYLKIPFDADNASQWTRNLLRIGVACLEGFANCFLDITPLAFALTSERTTRSEIALLVTNRASDSAERIKLSLRLAYKSFPKTGELPDFSGAEWKAAKLAIAKRHSLMHPRTPQDMEVDWDTVDMVEGIMWTLEQFDVFVARLPKKEPVSSG